MTMKRANAPANAPSRPSGALPKPSAWHTSRSAIPSFPRLPVLRFRDRQPITVLHNVLKRSPDGFTHIKRGQCCDLLERQGIVECFADRCAASDGANTRKKNVLCVKPIALHVCLLCQSLHEDPRVIHAVAGTEDVEVLVIRRKHPPFEGAVD